jgi:hypothetical protein
MSDTIAASRAARARDPRESDHPLFATLFVPDANEEQEHWFADLTRIFSKLDVESRARASVLAHESGLGP